jgi:hypothetical protein
MVYIDRYIPIYKFKYVYVHIRVRQQLEYTLKLKTTKKEKRDPLVSVGKGYMSLKSNRVGTNAQRQKPANINFMACNHRTFTEWHVCLISCATLCNILRNLNRHMHLEIWYKGCR